MEEILVFRLIQVTTSKPLIPMRKLSRRTPVRPSVRALAIASVFTSLSLPAPSSALEAASSAVISDGATVIVFGQTIRLNSIDAPASYQMYIDAAGKPLVLREARS